MHWGHTLAVLLLSVVLSAPPAVGKGIAGKGAVRRNAAAPPCESWGDQRTCQRHYSAGKKVHCTWDGQAQRCMDHPDPLETPTPGGRVPCRDWVGQEDCVSHLRLGSTTFHCYWSDADRVCRDRVISLTPLEWNNLLAPIYASPVAPPADESSPSSKRCCRWLPVLIGTVFAAVLIVFLDTRCRSMLFRYCPSLMLLVSRIRGYFRGKKNTSGGLEDV
eukprot:TRINITY_DN32187_c0_g1_i1.p1 TRINITY_DN32187_c0_g1~~TRINITY_DN32187_c0_g1_i1.p1  ORF type:complete len:218 (+),score=32.34 TRINITY_DN32187_c0_g1_i1:317-970(+)